MSELDGHKEDEGDVLRIRVDALLNEFGFRRLLLCGNGGARVKTLLQG
jgi:hypothetical protein